MGTANCRSFRCCLVRSAHSSRPPKRRSPSSKNVLKRAILDPLGRVKFLRSDCSSAVKASPLTTLTQYIRVAVSSVAVNSQTDFSLRRTLFRKRKIKTVVRTSFQYELNLEASIRLTYVVAVRNWLGFLFSSGRDWLIGRVPFGQLSAGRASHDGPCHQTFRNCIWSPRSPRERLSARLSRPGQCLHCVGVVYVCITVTLLQTNVFHLFGSLRIQPKATMASDHSIAWLIS